MDGRAASLFPDWPQYAGRIRDAVKDLTAEQLALRAGPEHAQIWQLAAHVAGTRVYWLCGRFVEQMPGVALDMLEHEPVGLRHVLGEIGRASCRERV